MPISQAEARMRAASYVLRVISQTDCCYPENWSGEDCRAVSAEQHAIERWLQERACGGDKTLLRQLRKPLGRQVRPTAKQAKRLGLPDA